MKLLSITFVSIFFLSVSAFADDSENNPDKSNTAVQLIQKMLEQTGNYEKLKSLVDVEYKYTVRKESPGAEDISIERYVFDGELSWAKYLKHAMNVLPDTAGDVIQGYNGPESWITVDGQIIDDPMACKLADFLRKTNFYWFAMMQKLGDPGLIYSYEGKRAVNDVNYDLVKVTFETGVGDVSDTYLLYLNPDTHLVDRFLFTVMDFNMTEPFMMTVEYKDINGVKLPAYRMYIESNWNGEVSEENWTEEIMTDIKFGNGFRKEDFELPE